MNAKDWRGNKKTTFVTLGSSSHATHERESLDYYATEPRCVEDVVHLLSGNKVWECACGQGHLSNRLRELGIEVRESDIIDRGIGAEVFDFLSVTEPWVGDILTNPPYKYAQEFVEQAIKLVPEGRRVIMFLKLTFLEGSRRKQMFEKYPPKVVMVYSSRRKCAINGDFESVGSSAACYAWFVWEKGFNGKPTIEWIK